mmetsp:Transcript_16653/g.50225  ORF Transcript_16653/g.50225 Transcript_16653/m.50225 type:complete len:322 (-) Transcript_16653:102-1067(-)
MKHSSAASSPPSTPKNRRLRARREALSPAPRAAARRPRNAERQLRVRPARRRATCGGVGCTPAAPRTPQPSAEGRGGGVLRGGLQPARRTRRGPAVVLDALRRGRSAGAQGPAAPGGAAGPPLARRPAGRRPRTRRGTRSGPSARSGPPWWGAPRPPGAQRRTCSQRPRGSRPLPWRPRARRRPLRPAAALQRPCARPWPGGAAPGHRGPSSGQRPRGARGLPPRPCGPPTGETRSLGSCRCSGPRTADFGQCRRPGDGDTRGCRRWQRPCPGTSWPHAHWTRWHGQSPQPAAGGQRAADHSRGSTPAGGRPASGRSCPEH